MVISLQFYTHPIYFTFDYLSDCLCDRQDTAQHTGVCGWILQHSNVVKPDFMLFCDALYDLNQHLSLAAGTYSEVQVHMYLLFLKQKLSEKKEKHLKCNGTLTPTYL